MFKNSPEKKRSKSSLDGNETITFELIETELCDGETATASTNVPDQAFRDVVLSFIAKIEEFLPQAAIFENRYKELLKTPPEERAEFNAKYEFLSDVEVLLGEALKFDNFVGSATAINPDLERDEKVQVVQKFSGALKRLRDAIAEALNPISPESPEVPKKRAKKPKSKPTRTPAKTPPKPLTTDLLDVGRKRSGEWYVRSQGEELAGLSAEIILAMLELYQDRDCVPANKTDISQAYKNAIEMGGVKGRRDPNRKLTHKLEREYNWTIDYEQLYQALLELYDAGLCFVFAYRYLYPSTGRSQRAKIPCFTPALVSFLIKNAKKNASFSWASRPRIQENLALLERDFKTVNTRAKQIKILDTRKIKLTD